MKTTMKIHDGSIVLVPDGSVQVVVDSLDAGNVSKPIIKAANLDTGVTNIYVTDIIKGLSGLHAICIIPDGYWYKEKNTISVSWPSYEDNRLNYMKERNIGGKIHDLLSTAVLKEA